MCCKEKQMAKKNKGKNKYKENKKKEPNKSLRKESKVVQTKKQY